MNSRTVLTNNLILILSPHGFSKNVHVSWFLQSRTSSMMTSYTEHKQPNSLSRSADCITIVVTFTAYVKSKRCQSTKTSVGPLQSCDPFSTQQRLSRQSDGMICRNRRNKGFGSRLRSNTYA